MSTEDCPHCGEDISDVTHGLKNALEVTREERTKYKDRAARFTDELIESKTLLEDANKRLKDADPEASQQLRTDLNDGFR